MQGLRHKPTDETRAQVTALKSYGVIQAEIATYLEISQSTLEKHYREELDKAQINANAAVARVLFEKATIDRDRASVFFWLKTRAGFRETNLHEITGKDGKDLQQGAKVDDVDGMMKQRFLEILNKDKEESDVDRDKPK